MLFKKEIVINDTVQLDIPIIDIPLRLENHPYETCKKCHRKKYTPQIKGFFPSFEKPVKGFQIFKSSEYFGSGAEAHNIIFVTKEFYDEIRSYKIKPNVMAVEP